MSRPTLSRRAVARDFSLAYQWARTYTRSDLRADLAAGLTGATAGAPQAMAFAIVAGISPAYGLYTAIISTLIGGLFSRSPLLTTGPTNALAVVIGSTLAPFAAEGDPIGRLVTLTFLVGVIELVLGLLRLGGLARYVSTAVMTGFITGAAILVLLGQLNHLTGIDAQAASPLLELGDLLRRLNELHVETFIIGVVTIAIIVWLHRTRLAPFATLVSIVVTGVAIALLGWHERGVALVLDMAPIPTTLPGVRLPEPRYALDLAPGALALAVLALVQTAALMQSIQRPEEDPPNTSQEFIVQGAANLAGALFRSMPAGGSLSRTAVNIKSGARSRWANVFAGLFVALIMLALGPLAERIALAALAGHLIVASTALIDRHQMQFIWRASESGRWAMLATLVSTLIVPLEYAVYIGVALSLLLYIEESSHIRLTLLERGPDGRYRESAPPRRLPDAEPVILSLQGNLSFAAMRELSPRLPDASRSRRPVVIMRLRGNGMLAGTGIAVIMAYHRRLRARGGKLILCGVEPRTYATLKRSGALELLGEENVFPAEEVVFASAEKAYDYAKQWLAEGEPIPEP